MLARTRLCRLLTAGCGVALLAAPLAADLSFTHVVIDASNPTNPHCKAIGDIDGDGLLDAIAASSSGDGMFWYEYPSWTKHAIRSTGSWTTDMQAVDIDGDGDLDVVIPNGTALSWYENPLPGLDPTIEGNWTEHQIGVEGANHHDVEVGDVEPDGDVDVVSRKKNGSDTSLWRQGPANVWTRVSLPSGEGEGTALGDLDGDGDLDVAHNGFWIRQVTPTSWTAHTIDASWSGGASDTGVTIADIDGNGDLDVVIAPSESAGRISWYEAVDPVAGPWTEHVIDATVSYLHTFKAADMDHDGDLDLVTAEMHQSSNPDEVSIYFNDGDGVSWSQQVVAESGSHNLRVGDFGADGDLDIFGANWNDGAPNSAEIEMWENTSSPLPLGTWQRHIIETSLPWNAVFVDGKDIDGDGLPDLVTGGWWYRNPGALGGSWVQQTIGTPLENAAVVHDLDGDGDFDVLGTDGKPGGEDFSWARNDGAGNFTNFGITNTATAGDFLQGVGLYQVIPGGREEIVLSWHNGGSGTALLSVPDDPTTTVWPLTVLSATTNQEQVPVGDLDGDGDIDLHLGTSWLRHDPGDVFSVQPGITLSGGGVPDRVVLEDLDGDGDLDVVIGVEFASTLVWGENDGSGGTWTERVIATDFDYFSVDARDVDGDGDVDVVGGAHMGSGEVSVYSNNGSGTAWTTHVVDSGTSTAVDHHDGTVLVDMDLDRDLDIISIGWSKRSLVIYENLAIDDAPPLDLTGPRIDSASAVGTATAVVVDFDEPVTAATAEVATNYAISGGITVSGATLAANGRAVTLTTTALTTGVEYTLSVSSVTDLAGNAIAPGSAASFSLGAGDPTSGLVAWWPFEEGAGTVAVDATGNGHTGFLTGGTHWIAESSGSALEFDGSNDYVDAGTFDVAGSALTLAAWIYPQDLENCSSNDCRIVSKSTSTAEADHYFMLSTIAAGGGSRLRFRLKTDGTTTTLIASGGDLPEGEWVHAAAVYDGATMELYLDGVSVGSTGKSGAISQNGSVPVWIGGNPTEPSGKPWDGKIDDVRIYDRALTATELAGLPPPSSDAIFADGFESGNISAWSWSTGVVEVLGAAARVGTSGLRAKAGTSCLSPNELIVPPGTVDGTLEACRTVWAESVEVVAPGAKFRAGELIVLGDGLAASSDLELAIDPVLTPFAWVRDTSPASETTYTAELDVRLDGLTLGAGDRLELLVASSYAGDEVIRLVVQSDGAGGHEAFLEARLDSGVYVATNPGEEVAIPAGWHRVRIEWTAGAGSGALTILVDGAVENQLGGLFNGAQQIDSIDWGVVDGSLDGASGFIDLDGFRSWR